MKITLQVSNSLYNCDVIVTEPAGTHRYSIDLSQAYPAHAEQEIEIQYADIELTVMPKMADYRSILSETETVGWKDKLANKVAGALFLLVDKTLLRVGCKYRITGLKDGDCLTLCGQEYVFGTFDRFDLFELIPMAYMFFEASYEGARCEITDAFAMNRKEVVSSAKKLTLLDFGLQLIFTYPIQVGRIKHLTSHRKIKKTLLHFHKMNDQQRQKILAKKERLIN